MSLVLSLFPGIGLLDMAFEEEGFTIVRGPDLLWGGDIKRFHPPAGKFDGVIGGPPCQAFSRLRHIVKANGYQLAENLIPEFERVVGAARPAWFLMENVEDAPHPEVAGYQTWRELVRDVWVGGQTNRLRAFFLGMPKGTLRALGVETQALHLVEPARAVTCDMRQIPVAIGGSGKYKPNAKGGAWKGHLPRSGPKESVETMAALQGVPPIFLAALKDHGAFTAKAIQTGIGNGVPLAMGRAVAKAVKLALNIQQRQEPK